MMDFRPGIIPLRPLTLGDLFGAIVKTIRGNVGATVGLAFLTSLVVLTPLTAIGAWMSSRVTLPDPATSGADPAGDIATLIASTGGQMLPSLGSAIVVIPLAGFIAYVVGQAVLGRKVSAAETWAGTRGRLAAIAGATLIIGLIGLVTLALIVGGPIALLVVGLRDGRDGWVATGIGLLILALLLALAWALFFQTRMAFATSSIVLEDLGVRAGMARSWRLTSGTPFWRILGLRLLISMIIGLAGSVITGPLLMLSYGSVAFTSDLATVMVVQTILGGVIGVVTGSLTNPATASVDALLYVDQRIRREGLDVRLIQASQGIGAPPWRQATLS